MSLTNDQITAKNFKEFYEAIRPYLNGNFPTPIANKFDKANMYSTDEQIVGRWIDGKPLYQKTFTIASMQKNGYEDFLTNVDHVHTVEKSYRRMQGAIDGDDFWYTTNAYVNIRAVSMDDGTLRITNCSSELLTDIIITVQYTKTTDTAMDIGSDTDYSTTEKIVGTWIDGKPLYQKTIQLTNITKENHVAHNISDIDVIAGWDGYLRMSDGRTIKLNDADPSGANFTTRCFVGKTEVNVYATNYTGNYPWTASGEVTIKYTKTTD